VTRLASAPVVVLLLVGCGDIDVDVGEVYPVSIVNDTTGAVVVRDCSSYCSSSPIAITLQPGQSTPINRVAGQHKLFSITTTSGAHVGCVDLYNATPAPNASFPVSRAVACRSGSHSRLEKVAIGAALLLLLGLGFIVVARFRSRTSTE
jgi:hypothetical protein